MKSPHGLRKFFAGMFHSAAGVPSSLRVVIVVWDLLFFPLLMIAAIFIPLWAELLKLYMREFLIFLATITTGKAIQAYAERGEPSPAPDPAPAVDAEGLVATSQPDLMLTPSERKFFRPEYVTKYGQTFAQAIAFTLDHEVVWRHGQVATEHDPNDRGGATRYGIDQRDHPGVDVENLSEADAVEIYFKHEWRLSDAAKYPPRLALVIFDSAVNPGLGVVHEWERSDSGKRFSQSQDDKTAIKDLLAARVAYYKRRPSAMRASYLAGWLARTEDLRHVALS